MSGPKTVNIRIHDQGLNSVISTQSEIIALVRFIECFSINDSARSFVYEGSASLETLRPEIKACLASVDLPRQSELSYSQSGALANAIRDKQQALEKLKNMLKGLKQQCEACQKDYVRSVSVQTELQACLDNGCDNLKKLISSIETYLNKQDAVANPREVMAKLQQIPTQLQLPKFSMDLHKAKAKLQDKVLGFYKDQEDKVLGIHAQFCSELNIVAINKTGFKRSASPARQQLLCEIAELLDQLPESPTKEKIRCEFEYYCNTPEYCTDTTCRHLKSKLLGCLASTDRRKELLLIQHKLCDFPPSEACTHLQEMVREEITQDLISESNFIKLSKAWEALEAENQRQQLEQYAREQESRYIKEKLVKALGYLNYTVVSNAKGLPESHNSFLFRVPNQENYIYVEYLKGKYLYNFMVPEKVSELTREDLRRKVSEMGNACQGFLQAMRNLQAYGVNFDYTHKEASENNVISIPEAIRKSMNLDVHQEKQQRHYGKEQKKEEQ